ncbi:hypothetical protein [Thiomicrorhabdus sediminis]|uniref:Uncharacterized protein n=1 Tax=Thiomicrorhabdus sediminis TaxID=2580412 RepID=A0A4P9K6L5_9GAMM|nr:hypothetical protein [Thiomicrorhabdus sediminis]QCU90649.1 hypothetical protein FE785_08385 [Thiomicrorhabdus sediminis]
MPENQSAPAVQNLNKINIALFKSLFYGTIWAFAFAWLLPEDTLDGVQYLLFVSSLPATFIWQISVEQPLWLIAVALVNLLVLLIPYFYYLKTGLQLWWLYWSLSLYGFMNAAMAFILSINLLGPLAN